MNGIVVVDATLAFKWLVSEENSDLAQSIFRSWANARNPSRSALPDAGGSERTPSTGGSCGVN